MECRAVHDVADSFLADELEAETSDEVLRHLEGCAPCRADLDARAALRDGIRRAFENAPRLQPRPGLIEDVRGKLHSSAAVPNQPAKTRRREWALAAAVLLAVTVGGAYRGREWWTTTALARMAVGDHRDCALTFRLAERSIPLEEAARNYDVAYRVLETEPPADVTTAIGSARVLKRHACIYQGRRFAHVVLQYRGGLVSLLTTAVDGTAPDGGDDSHAGVDARPRQVSSSRIDGLALVSFRAARHMIFLTGDLPQDELLELAEAIDAPLSRELARP
jgi:HAMP domain-containing protein